MLLDSMLLQKLLVEIWMMTIGAPRTQESIAVFMQNTFYCCFQISTPYWMDTDESLV
jgi:hypothetical protein